MKGEQGPPCSDEAVRRLTARIAHEFGNILTVVLSKADLLADAASPEPAQVRADLEDLRRAARRGADMTETMLSFCRTQPVETTVVDLARIVEGMKATIDRLLPEDVEVRMGPATPGRLRVRADAGAIQQILLNLVANARDAVPDGGVVEVTTERTCSDAGGEVVSLLVADTGPGIAPELRERVFEPFYTTKEPGRGVGLGLSLVHGLARQHGGTVTIEDTPGGGAAVRVRFPAVSPEDPAPDDAAPDDTEVPSTRAGVRILVAEDEEVIRQSARRILERFGYFVLLAADGAEGLDRLMDPNERVDLVISDIVMPGLDGLEFHQRARRSGVRVPFLFTSGYRSDEVRGLMGEDPAADFLPKPWTVPELVARVRGMLGSPRPLDTHEVRP